MDSQLVKHILQQHSITRSGFAPLGRPLSMDQYSAWIDRGFHADMNYLSAHLPKKENPTLVLPNATSAIVIAADYPAPDSDFPLTSLKVAKYARGRDYHYWLKEKIEAVCVDLRKLFPSESFLAFTDSSPVLERDLAYQAGLGWFGKNSCLISRQHGSYFLLSEIYTSLSLATEAVLSPDHCGTCNRCMEACPTDAIQPDRTLDASKCISYWTIEAKSTPPLAMAENFSSWFFGCDICQDVCPWNGKVYAAKYAPISTSPDARISELRWILSASGKELEREFRHTPLLRARGRGLKRNALIVIANLRLKELEPEVVSFLDHPELGEIARWTQQHLSSL